MSLVEICLKFEEVISYLSSSTEETSNLSKFFSSYKKIVENFSSSLLRLSETIKVNTNPESNFNTLSLALLTLKEHVKNVAENNMLLVKNLQLDVIEPLDLFTEHFLAMFSELKSRGLEVYKTVNLAQVRLQKQRKEYYKVAAESEKTNRTGSFEEFKDSSKAFQKLQQAQESCLNKYIEGILEVNRLWDDYDRKMPQVMEDLQQNEESRIHFIKNSLEKYIKYYQKYENMHFNNIEKLGEIISNINSLLDIRVFVDLHKSKDQVYRETFVNYEEYKQKLAATEEDFEDLSIESNINQLLSQSSPNKSSGISSETFNKLSEMISTSEGRKMFIESLKTHTYNSTLPSESITQIAALIKEIFNLMIKESEYDAEVFVTVVDLGNLFYCVENDRKKFLCSFISPHHFWLDSKRWMQGLEYAISTRMASLKESQKEKGVLQYLGFFTSNKALDEKLEKADRVSAYIMVSQFILQMSRLQVPQGLAANIITTAGNVYEIDSERNVLLLTELFSRSNAKIKTTARFVKETDRYFVVLDKISKFLQKDDLAQVALICKKTWKRVKKVRARRILIDSSLVLPETRIETWIQLLDSRSVSIDYEQTLKLVETSKELLGDINEIIDLDVVRCFQRVSSITTTNLSNILKVYAYKNKEIGYCQGMNYIAGTFFLIFHSEEAAFKSLYSLISTFKLNSLFKIEISKIKKLFFILDRLIGEFLPDLNETFKESWVFADNYSSGWLITLFASVFHSKLEVIVMIWDSFLCFGWKGIFRVCLQILDELSESLFHRTFEEILAELSSINSKEIFTKEFFQRANRFKVTNRLIRAIKLEFRSLKQLTTHN